MKKVSRKERENVRVPRKEKIKMKMVNQKGFF
jgi:hypothetical protein